MRTLPIALLTTLLVMSSYASAGSARHCVAVDGKWGANCGSSGSYGLSVTNNCSVPIYVKACVEKTNGDWFCGSNSSLKPGMSYGGTYTCAGTGRSRWDACTGGFSECGFPNP